MGGSELDVLVIGAGVVGLTTAVCLAESGLRVGIRTAAPPGASTSAAAGAIWGPVMTGPARRTREWARTSLDVLRELEDDPATGIRSLTGREVSRFPADPPDWIDLLDDMRLCRMSELPPGFVSGWRYTAPLVNMPVYLEYLRARFGRAGGRIDVNPVTSLAEVTEGCHGADAQGATKGPAEGEGSAGSGEPAGVGGAAGDRGTSETGEMPSVVINCSGVAARELVPDPAVAPVRGQVVVITNPGIEEFYIDHTPAPLDVVYMFPHRDTVVLGGTVAPDDWDTTPRPEVAERILRDCAAVDPRVLGATVLGHRVGLRPTRPEVRLESEPLEGGRVLWHNYGHGGGGVTLSWGCALEITAAVLGGTDRGGRGDAGPRDTGGPVREEKPVG
jgi:D-amino-acid oxidase